MYLTMDKLQSIVSSLIRGNDQWLCFRLPRKDDTVVLATKLIRAYCDYLEEYGTDTFPATSIPGTESPMSGSRT